MEAGLRFTALGKDRFTGPLYSNPNEMKPDAEGQLWVLTEFRLNKPLRAWLRILPEPVIAQLKSLQGDLDELRRVEELAKLDGTCGLSDLDYSWDKAMLIFIKAVRLLVGHPWVVELRQDRECYTICVAKNDDPGTERGNKRVYRSESTQTLSLRTFTLVWEPDMGEYEQAEEEEPSALRAVEFL